MNYGLSNDWQQAHGCLQEILIWLGVMSLVGLIWCLLVG